ncbi:MAG: D-2-hydroxyacid dehydrogenase [Proteobacteria bacterium]|nr:D-2-hydroxyacid dehydrogenase [Pseudomonadota bacterium]
MDRDGRKAILREGKALRIVVLDGHTANPGDLSWDALQEFGSSRVYDRTPKDKVRERAEGADILLTNKVILNEDLMDVLPALRYIGVLATGYNVVDTAAAASRGIIVTNIPEYSTASVAQLTFALLLELARGPGLHARAVREGKWSASPDFSFHLIPQRELSGLTFGIVGFGRIGKAVAELALAFGMDVLVATRKPGEEKRVTFVEPDVLFSQGDVVSLHCPLTPRTEKMVDERRLGLMKPSSFLINTARGPLIDENALARALNEGRIAGAALDVLSSEPPPAGHPLLSARNCVITPHLAWATLAARKRLVETAIANIRAWVEGNPVNVVNQTEKSGR